MRVHADRQRVVHAREPGGEAVGEEDVLLAEARRGAGADAEALVEADARGAHRARAARAISWLEARAAFSRVSRRGGAGGACAAGRRGRASGRRRGRGRGFAAKKRADAGVGARRVGDVVVGEEQQLARGRRRARRCGCARARSMARRSTVTSGRAASRSSAGPSRRIGVRLLHQHQVVDPGLGRPGARRRGRAPARRGSRPRR